MLQTSPSSWYTIDIVAVDPTCYFHIFSPDCTTSLPQKATLVLSELSSSLEAGRRLVADSTVIQSVVALLQSSTDPMLQVAICNLVKHLARSPKFLRDELISSGVIDPLLELFHHAEGEVLAGALGAMANLIADFSPLKNLFLHNGGLVRLRDLLSSSVAPDVRLFAAWVLKNMLYHSSKSVKDEVLQDIPLSSIMQLLAENEDLACEGIKILTNLLYGSTMEDVTRSLQSLGEDFIPQLLLIGCNTGSQSLLTQIMVCLSNVLCCQDAATLSPLNCPEFVHMIKKGLTSENQLLVESALWALRNMLCADSVSKRLRLNIIIQEEVEEVLSSLCVKDLPVPLRSRAILVMDSIATAREEQSPPS